MSFELFIARRIYGDKTEGPRFSRPAVRIAIAGIAIGLIVMIVSVAVVLGFKREVSGKVIGFGSHAQILSLTQDQNYVIYPVVTNDSLKEVVKKTKGVKHIQEFAGIAGMLKTDEDFRGIADFRRERLVVPRADSHIAHQVEVVEVPAQGAFFPLSRGVDPWRGLDLSFSQGHAAVGDAVVVIGIFRLAG